jgi:hypothetical protein
MIFGQRGALMKDLMGFCNKITPRNWYVTTRREQFTFRGPGTLNILVRIPDHFIDGWFYAFKKGSMNFYPVSLYTGQDSDALESLQIYGEHLVAESEIWLYPEGCQFFGDDLYAAVVHELAHVAVDRWVAFRCKSYKEWDERPAAKEESHHGKVFCKAFETLIMRANTLGGSDHQGIFEPLRFELNNYRYEMTSSVQAVH